MLIYSRPCVNAAHAIFGKKNTLCHSLIMKSILHLVYLIQRIWLGWVASARATDTGLFEIWCRWKFWEFVKTDIHHVYYKMPPDQRLSLKREIRGGMDSDARSLNWYSFQRWSQPFNTTQSESGSRQEIFFFLYIYIWSDPTAQNEPKILSPAIRLLKYLSKIGILLRTPHVPMKVKTSDLSVQNMVPWR